MCVCVYGYVQVWAAFWGMSPELCSGLAIHCPPLHNGQNHTTMRLDRGRIPGMLNYRARHSPLPLTENTHKCLTPHLLFPTPGSDGRNNIKRQERAKVMSYCTGERQRLINKWSSGSGHLLRKDYVDWVKQAAQRTPTYDCNFCNLVSLSLILQSCLASCKEYK